ncbi:MAG: DUF1850 domain-containing protein [Rhodoferax sp.]
MSALGVCLSVIAALGQTPPAPSATVFVPVTAFTLAWTHSIEKVRWEEDYAAETDAGTGQPQLHALAARIKGSAAGMEPPDDAVLRNGWYHYKPPLTHPGQLRLTRSAYTADYEWCAAGRCQPMSKLIAATADITTVSACFNPKPDR